MTRVRGKNVEGTGRGGRAYLQYSKRSDDSVPESHPRPFRQMLDVPLTWVRPWASHLPLPSTFQNGRGGTRSRTRSLICDPVFFFFLFPNPPIWILDFRGDENIRREIDNVERCV